MALFGTSVLNTSPSGVAQSNIQHKSRCLSTNTHITDTQNTVPVSTDPNSSSSTGDFTHKGIGLHPVRERGAVSTLTHILPFLTWLQQWCNALGFSPSPHLVPAHPWIFVPPSSPPLLLLPLPSLSLPGSSNIAALAPRSVKSLRALGRHGSEKLSNVTKTPRGQVPDARETVVQSLWERG